MSVRDRLAEEEWKKRAPLRKVWTWKEGFIDGWNMHKKCGEEYHAVLELKLEEEKKKTEALVEALEDGTINSIRETLALMAEGEGPNPETYMAMANSALKKLDKALADYKGTNE